MRVSNGLAGGSVRSSFGTSSPTLPGQQAATNCQAGTIIYMAGQNAPCPTGYVFVRNTGGAIGVPWKTECQCIGVAPSSAQSAPQQAAPTNVNVQTTVSPSIQVSPQISPNLIQQFQPSGSPVTAGTSQTVPQITQPQQTPVPPPQYIAPPPVTTAPEMPQTIYVPQYIPAQMQQPQQSITVPTSGPNNIPTELPQTISSQQLPGFPTSTQEPAQETKNYLPYVLGAGLLAILMMKGKKK